ncbi:hypothetical protein [Nostoc sp.]|uniref:hypothetical protein n=1 Tax=Nostoc sp. TaxID=1180 RepID=UPI002FF8B815
MPFAHVADFKTNDIARYNGKTGEFIDFFVTSNSGGLSAPAKQTFGYDGNLYVSSILTNNVLRYNGKTGAFIDAFVPAGSGGLRQPRFLYFTKDAIAIPESRTGLALLAFGATLSLGKVIGRFQKRHN